MKYQVYGIIRNENLNWKITSDIEVDLSFWYDHGIHNLFVLTPSLSIGHAEDLVKCLEKQVKPQLTFLYKRISSYFTKNISNKNASNNNSKLKLAIKNVEPIILRCLRNFNINSILEIQNTNPGFQALLDQYLSLKESASPFFHGKLLLLSEVIELLSSSYLRDVIPKANISNFVQIGYLLNEINLTSGVSYPKDRKANLLKCNRCGSKNRLIVQECAICNENCATCEECIAIGRSKTCTPLLHFPVTQEKYEYNIRLKSTKSINSPSLQLTQYQENTAKIALNFIKDKKNKDLLIWAVTGAGKTEMIFPAVTASLEMGYRVLLTSPRKDVIKELIPRFKQAFSDVSIVSLYGGSDEKWGQGSLYLATTHQTIRFKDFFDIIIIDEMDAFPYHNNSFLQLYVQRALKKDGKKIYMTATPSSGWLDRMKRNEITSTILPIRYHTHPLPIPYIEIIPKRVTLLNKPKPIKLLEEFINKVKEQNGQAFLFVSEVKEVLIWTKRLQEWLPNEIIDGVHANDPNREKKVNLFRRGEIQFLITTTIMERGITVPNVHVLIIGAEAKIFNEATLVQIAGRVGRTAKYPNGLVWFLAEFMTDELIKAKKQIKKMNNSARKL